ncbi:putative endonuclease IV [Actinoplanes missouriensis 431]|uniref:Probable endonuclease 4 n=1 Tax=Actinoplanes missouriensis (strain ATCC 14538 / DSM 43046 / CBS 188.64 / JCM 3121 / NBRC 102363 / NCIMB 12654 / NRRL B-3342 / UNCC 431) TaxID=512565 RepID=I0H106_ACTM4|nr:deoxyribonuclease IV [Actinoplanes missouriensis]BAL86693.1 putative endonuclease IV [Actinoplanes missouriensis 431]
MLLNRQGAHRRIGSHTKTSGGLAKAALPYVDAAGSETLQVYVSNSRGWALPAGDPKQDTLFRDGCGERGVPAYIHASLLVNLGSPTELTVERSVATLEHALLRGKAIGATAVVYHAGSSVDEAHADKAMHQLHESLLPLLDRAAAEGLPRLLVEPSAGGGRSLASKVQDLAGYLDAVERHPWLGVCFDTCHAWAAGHDLATPGGMTETLDALVEAAGPGRLQLIHANDSKDACGSTRDRHETIGKGTIGAAPFAELFAHPATDGVPVIVETPTVEHEGHAADIALLKSLRDGDSAGQ